MPVREYRIDVIVDDHGAVQKMQDVAKAGDQITASVPKTAEVIDIFGKRSAALTQQVAEFNSALIEESAAFSAVAVSEAEADHALSAITVSQQQAAAAATAETEAVGALTLAEGGLVLAIGYVVDRMIQKGVEATGLDAKIQHLTESIMGWKQAEDLVDVTGLRTLSMFALLNMANKDLSESEFKRKEAILATIAAQQAAIDGDKAFLASQKENQKFWDDFYKKQEADAQFDAAFINGVYEEMADRRKEINAKITKDVADQTAKQLKIVNDAVVESLRYLYQYDDELTVVGHGTDDFTQSTDDSTAAIYRFAGSLSATNQELSEFFDQISRFGLGGDVTTGAGAIPVVSPNGPRVPHFATGGPVTRDGLIYAHAGEYVLNKQQAQSGSSGAVTISIDARGAQFTNDAAIEQLAAKVSRVLGRTTARSLSS